VGAVATRGEGSYARLRVFTVKLPPELYDLLARKSRASGVPMAVIVRMAITEYLGLNSNKPNGSRKITIRE